MSIDEENLTDELFNLDAKIGGKELSGESLLNLTSDFVDFNEENILKEKVVDDVNPKSWSLLTVIIVE